MAKFKISPNSVEYEDLPELDVSDLNQIQSVVGGYFEMSHAIVNNTNAIMLVHEDAKILKEEYNAVASMIKMQPIWGTVIILTEEDKAKFLEEV